MIRLTITPAAYTAILATHPASTGLKRVARPTATFTSGSSRNMSDQLRATRKLGETFSEVILRLAEASEGA